LSTQPTRSYKRYIVVGVLIIFLIASFLPIIPVAYEVTEPRQKTETYWEKEPYQVTKTESKTLINEKPTVSAGKYVYYSIYIDVSGKERNVVSGKVIETAGYDISFYVFDQKGFNTWKGGGSASAYVSAGKIKDYSYSFVPDHTDYYCFILDNGYSWFINKVPQITATWNYQVTVTEYRDVQKTRTITEYVKITKTKYVSLFQLLTGTG
jgi:hypothetical protein